MSGHRHGRRARRAGDGLRCYAAEFGPSDGAALVRAAFACPRCLAAASSIRLVDAQVLPVAEAACVACGRPWQVELTLAQLLRLCTTRTPGLEVRLGRQARELPRRCSLGDADIAPRRDQDA